MFKLFVVTVVVALLVVQGESALVGNLVKNVGGTVDDVLDDVVGVPTTEAYRYYEESLTTGYPPYVDPTASY